MAIVFAIHLPEETSLSSGTLAQEGNVMLWGLGLSGEASDLSQEVPPEKLRHVSRETRRTLLREMYIPSELAGPALLTGRQINQEIRQCRRGHTRNPTCLSKA